MRAASCILIMIQQRPFGRTGRKISELTLGTLNFGWQTDEATAFALLDAYHAAGGNAIQTASLGADRSAPSLALMQTEDLVARWRQSRGIPDGWLLIATRFRLRPAGDERGAFARALRRQCEESLRRLRTARLDLVLFEWDGERVPVDEMLAAFDQVVRAGLVRSLGVADMPAWRVADCLSRAYRNNWCRWEALQADYSLMVRARFEPEAMALCREQRLAFLARSPLAGGFLTRREDGEDSLPFTRRHWLNARFDNAYGEAALAAVAEIAARHEASPAQVALAWVLRNPVVTSATIGVRSLAQLDELVQGGRLALSEADCAQLAAATAAEEVRLADPCLV